MTKLDDFLTAYAPDLRLPFHDSRLTWEGVDHFSTENDTPAFVPISIPNLRGRNGLIARLQANNGTPIEQNTTDPITATFVLSVSKSYDGGGSGFWMNGAPTNGYQFFMDNWKLIFTSYVSGDSGHTIELEHELPGPGVYLVGLELDAANGDYFLYLDGTLVDSTTTGGVHTINGEVDPRFGEVSTRYPADVGNWIVPIDNSPGVAMAEWMQWHNSLEGAAMHAALYDALFVTPTLPFEFISSTPTITIATAPPDPVDDLAIIAAFEAEVVRPVRWVDIYDTDNSTILYPQVRLESGSVSVDMERDERRNFEFVMAGNSIEYGPDDFWYDKFIRPYRGVEFADGSQWVVPLGQFMPDAISRPHFPNKYRVTCRDLTKKLLLSKFAVTTTFSSGTNVGTAISAIATNGGITNQNFATVSNTLPADVTLDPGTPRWQAMKDMANSIGYELFFDAWGVLVFRPYVDPTTAIVAHTFQDGTSSNLTTYDRSTNDSRLFNDIIVYGTSTESAGYWGRAQNIDVNSPTRIAKLGQRTKTFGFQYLESSASAASIAAAFLKVSGLEQYDVNFSGLVLPWLDVGEAIEFDVSTSQPVDPTRFLLASLTIPMAIEPMTANSRRVINVG